MFFGERRGTGGNGEGGEIKQTFDSECFSLCFWSWFVSKYEQKPLILAFSHVSKIKTFFKFRIHKIQYFLAGEVVDVKFSHPNYKRLPYFFLNASHFTSTTTGNVSQQ